MSRKLVLAGLVVALGLVPALAESGPSGRDTVDPPAVPSTPPRPDRPTPPDSPVPSTGTPPIGSPSSLLDNRAACERAGGKWLAVQMKCEIDR
jgi:hypothetical protein